MQVEALQAVGFMYMRPPGYNAESARAAEIADERKKLGLDAPPSSSQDASLAVATQRYFTQTVGILFAYFFRVGELMVSISKVFNHS